MSEHDEARSGDRDRDPDREGGGASGSGSGLARPKLVLVGGGARSGKSRFALRRAQAFGPKRIYIATAEPLDGEMAERIDRHRAERDALEVPFTTMEEPRDLAEAIRKAGSASPDVVLVDCLTLWTSNLLVRGDDDRAMGDAAAHLLDALERRTTNVVLVTNEVGQGVVPDTELGRRFRDHAGRLTQEIAARADEVYGALTGLILRLVPSPVSVCAGPPEPTDSGGSRPPAAGRG